MRRRALLAILAGSPGCISVRQRAQPTAQGETSEPTPRVDTESAPTTSSTPLPDYPAIDRFRAAIREAIEARRQELGGSSVSGNGAVAAELREIANHHSRAMADAGAVGKAVAGSSLDESLRARERRCQTMIGSEMTEHAELAIVDAIQIQDRTPRAVATALLDRWGSDRDTRRLLGAGGLAWIGQGVVLERGRVWVTVIFC